MENLIFHVSFLIWHLGAHRFSCRGSVAIATLPLLPVPAACSCPCDKLGSPG
jgi:hypothetical protein